MKRVETRVISSAMYELGRTIQCADGVANVACNEAVLRLDEQTVEINVLQSKLAKTQQDKSELVDMLSDMTRYYVEQSKLADPTLDENGQVELLVARALLKTRR